MLLPALAQPPLDRRALTLARRPAPPRPLLPQMNVQQMSRMLPPHMLKMMGGPAAIQQLMKQMEGKF